MSDADPHIKVADWLVAQRLDDHVIPTVREGLKAVGAVSGGHRPAGRPAGAVLDAHFGVLNRAAGSVEDDAVEAGEGKALGVAI